MKSRAQRRFLNHKHNEKAYRILQTYWSAKYFEKDRTHARATLEAVHSEHGFRMDYQINQYEKKKAKKIRRREKINDEY